MIANADVWSWSSIVYIQSLRPYSAIKAGKGIDIHTRQQSMLRLCRLIKIVMICLINRMIYGFKNRE